MHKRQLIFTFIAGFLTALFLAAGGIFLYSRLSLPVSSDHETQKFQNEGYYARLSEALQKSQTPDTRTVPSVLQADTPNTFVWTDYRTTDRRCHVLLDLYFSEEDRNSFQSGKEKLFLSLDPNLLWATDTLFAQLLRPDSKGSFVPCRKLDVNAESLSSFSIFLSQLKREDFPCHIQIELEAPWNSETPPDEITYRYFIK